MRGRRNAHTPPDQLALTLAGADPAEGPAPGSALAPPAEDAPGSRGPAAASGGPPTRTLSPSAEAILADLTPEQRAAVTHASGPLLIVAGAGTGKTRVITRRIAYLIATRRARPEQILALTFTDRAAAEMEERVDRLVPYGYTQAWIGTFHAFGDRVLR